MANTNPDPESRGLLKLLMESGAVRFGEFTLTSGQKSDVYIDIKRVWTEPERLRMLARALAAHRGDAEQLAGMELGAVPLVVATALQTGMRYSVIRKGARTHGLAQRVEGEIPPETRVLIIEDVSTTGGSIAESVRILREAGAQVTRALVVVDRESGAETRLHEMGVHLEALATLGELRGSER
jgi:orotate phosphoribosyltransferase